MSRQICCRGVIRNRVEYSGPEWESVVVNSGITGHNKWLLHLSWSNLIVLLTHPHRLGSSLRHTLSHLLLVSCVCVYVRGSAFGNGAQMMCQCLIYLWALSAAWFAAMATKQAQTHHKSNETTNTHKKDAKAPMVALF